MLSQSVLMVSNISLPSEIGLAVVHDGTGTCTVPCRWALIPTVSDGLKNLV